MSSGIEESLSNNIKELIVLINKDPNMSDAYRKYITEFHYNWGSRQENNQITAEKGYLWGSKVDVPGNLRIKDVFKDNLYNNVNKFFEENNIDIISDLSEEGLLDLMYYPGVGYLRFMNILYTLFVFEYGYQENEIYEEMEFKINKTEEKEEELGDSAAIAMSGSIVDNYSNLNEVENSLNENVFIDLLDSNKILIENIEKEQKLIVKLQNLYSTLQSNLTYVESVNINLEKQIEDLRQSHADEINFLNKNYDNFKLEKEEKIATLEQELENLQLEREKDKKVLYEFQNMIKILERIKGIFKQE